MPWYRYDSEEPRDYLDLGPVRPGTALELDPAEYLGPDATPSQVADWLPDYRWTRVPDPSPFDEDPEEH